MYPEIVAELYPDDIEIRIPKFEGAGVQNDLFCCPNNMGHIIWGIIIYISSNELKTNMSSYN